MLQTRQPLGLEVESLHRDNPSLDLSIWGLNKQTRFWGILRYSSVSVENCTSMVVILSNRNLRDVLSANGEIIEAINDVAASQGNAICACVIVS